MHCSGSAVLLCHVPLPTVWSHGPYKEMASVGRLNKVFQTASSLIFTCSAISFLSTTVDCHKVGIIGDWFYVLSVDGDPALFLNSMEALHLLH